MTSRRRCRRSPADAGGRGLLVAAAARDRRTRRALDAHRGQLDLAERRLRSRRASALREFSAEHGERALRALGGRREAEGLLASSDPALSVDQLVANLEAAEYVAGAHLTNAPRAGGPSPSRVASRTRRPSASGRWGLGPSAAVALGVFVVVSLISWVAGAANLGVAIGIGQIAFGLVVVALMVWAR